MMNSTIEMPEPISIVNNTPDGKLCINEEAVRILDKITQPVVVVAIVGLYRTGKSYLLNRLAGKRNGFALGSTIESTTKGIWMWCVPHPCKEDHTLVLLDTEGLGDIEKGNEKHDIWIFTLAVLLSSTLVYNSQGTIDNNALEKLHYVAKLSENIKVYSDGAEVDMLYDQSVEFMQVFPSFVWTVRDFTLNLGMDGKQITADEYLEKALTLKPGDSEEVKKYNLPRSNLRDFFAVRKCFVFQWPICDPNKMNCLEEQQDEDLNPRFVEKANEFCEYIFTESKVKTMKGGLKLTGRMLASLAETYVEVIRSGQLPCLESAVETLTQTQNSRAVTEAVEFYRTEMTKKIQFPTKTEEISAIHGDVVKHAISIFINGSFNDQEQKYQLELMKMLDKVYEEFIKENKMESCKVCESTISRVFGPLENAVREGSYLKPGGYAEYCTTLEKAKEEYRSEKGCGIIAEQVLTAYLTEQIVIQKTIASTDSLLNDQQKKAEDERLQKEALLQQIKKQEEEMKLSEQLRLSQEKTYEEHISQLKKQLETQKNLAKEELDRLRRAKLQEHKRTLMEGLQERADKMQPSINNLKHKQPKEYNISNILSYIASHAELVVALLSAAFQIYRAIR